uniref:Uncharacterized protein n=1 Tax=Anguilla anguilla TaxID=7936 RepID=A0A0E9QT62_ANGAN
MWGSFKRPKKRNQKTTR